MIPSEGVDDQVLRRLAARLIAPKDPEAPAWAPFGQFAWAPFREGVPEEPDTDLEKQVYEDLHRHFSNKRIGLPVATANILFMMMALGWYKPVLHAPPYETLYRGIKLRGKEAVALLVGIPVNELEETGAVNLETSASIPSINGYSSSWSFKKIITRDFSTKGERGYSVTFLADVEDNPFHFLAGPGGLYDVEGISMYHLEKETVGLEPILIRRIEWQRL